MVRFVKGFKIGTVSGIILSIFVYGILFSQTYYDFKLLASVFLNPYALGFYKILIFLSPAFLVLVLIKNFNHREKLDMGIMTGISWSFAFIQMIMLLINQPSIVNDFFKGNFVPF